jgi:chromosome segregation ATPase
MSAETQNAVSGPSGDGLHVCADDVEDFLSMFSTLTTHRGFSQISDLLSQVANLRRSSDSLLEETQHLRDAHEEKIEALEQMDLTFRQKSLKDYTEAVERVKKEKDRLTRETQNLKTRLEQQISATQAAEQLHKTQAEAADALRKTIQGHEESTASANQKLQEVQKKLNEAQQAMKKFDDILKRRDQTESKLKEEASSARKEAQDQKKGGDKLQKKLDKIKGYLVPPTVLTLTEL